MKSTRAVILLLVALLLHSCGGGSGTAPTSDILGAATQSVTSTTTARATATTPANPMGGQPEESASAPTPEADPVAGEGYARPEVLVDTGWVLARLDDPTVRLVDVSPNASTYSSGHLPGASYVDPGRDLTNPNDPVRGQILTREALSELFSRVGIRRDDTVVFYDDSDNLFAARAYWVLKYYQHSYVRVYNGGSKKWVADGQELVSGQVEVAPSAYEAGLPDPAIRTTWQDVVAGVDDPGTLFCDARSLGEYSGDVVNAEQGGHIPGAVNVEWTNAVRPDATFKEAADLRQLYLEAGFSPEKRIITYCQTGVRGAHTWFVLRELLGYPDVRNYDGSWEEYGNRDDSPIEK